MRGQKHTDETRIKAIELLSVYSVAEVARQLGIHENTIRTWSQGKTKASKADSEQLVELRAKRKREFVDDAWEGINDAKDLIKDRLKADKALPIEERKLRSTDLTNILGVLYDKQALANNESTANLGGSITIETLVKKVEGEEY